MPRLQDSPYKLFALALLLFVWANKQTWETDYKLSVLNYVLLFGYESQRVQKQLNTNLC